MSEWVRTSVPPRVMCGDARAAVIGTSVMMREGERSCQTSVQWHDLRHRDEAQELGYIKRLSARHAVWSMVMYVLHAAG